MKIKIKENLGRIILSIFFSVGWIIPRIVDWNDPDIRVWFLNVEQGDSILIVTPGGKVVLIDGGPGDYVLSELGSILPPWVNKIDIVVLTHPHADHFLGLLDVFDRYKVDQFWWNPVDKPVYGFDVFEEIMANLSVRGMKVSSICSGSYLLESDISLDVLWPICSDCGGICESWDGNLNNDSVVIVLDYLDFEVLLTGDAESAVESKIIDVLSRKYSEIEILKAGHHCSRTASSEELLAQINFNIAVCSCGKDNRFDHPHNEALSRFQDFAIKVFRTDTFGRIMVSSNGESWRISSEKG